MKCRKQQIVQWESTIAQPFLAADAGRGSLSLIWKYAVKAEAAVARGQHFGGFLWDLARMFDQIGHCRAVVRARQLGLSESLIRASMCAYRNARFVKLNEATACGIDCKRGVAPGCALATTWAKIVVAQGLADIAARQGKDGSIDFAVYVDDFSVAAAADDPARLVAKLKQFAEELRDFIQDDLKGVIAADKRRFSPTRPVMRALLRRRWEAL